VSAARARTAAPRAPPHTHANHDDCKTPDGDLVLDLAPAHAAQDAPRRVERARHLAHLQ